MTANKAIELSDQDMGKIRMGHQKEMEDDHLVQMGTPRWCL